MIILPHGGFALIPATIATMAWMTSLSLDGCDYARLTGPAVETLTHSNIHPYLEIGFHSYRIPSFYSSFESWEIRFSDPCVKYNIIESSTKEKFLSQKSDSEAYSYDDESIDPTMGFFWSIGGMSHKIATIVGGTATLFLWVPCLCLSYTERAWRIGGLQLLVAAFFHLCSLVWFFNSLCMERGSKCHLYYGSYSSLASLALYVASFICVFWKYPTPIIVKVVQERIEEEFQKYQTDRPPFERQPSSGTHLTEASQEDSENLGNKPITPRDNFYPQRRTGFGLNQHENI